MFKAGNYSNAVKILKKLSAKKKVELTFIDEAKKILSEIDKRGAALLKQAKEAMEQEDYGSALKALFELTVCFNGLPF